MVGHEQRIIEGGGVWRPRMVHDANVCIPFDWHDSASVRLHANWLVMDGLGRRGGAYCDAGDEVVATRDHHGEPEFNVLEQPVGLRGR